MIGAREIYKRSGYTRNEVRELLQAIFSAELIRPSKTLWLVSPWISDIPVIDDLAEGFSDSLGAGGTTKLALSDALVRLASEGTNVRIVTRPGDSAPFEANLRRRERLAQVERPIPCSIRDRLHTKGLVGDDYRIVGSMNFTFNGIDINDELIRFDRDRDAIARMRLEFAHEYGEA